MEDIIAEKDLVGINPNGSRFTIMLKIGRPQIKNDGWVCSIGAVGLDPEMREVSASDSFQALMRGRTLLAQILEFFIDDGGRIVSAVDDTPVSLDALFD